MNWIGIYCHPGHCIPMDGNRLLSAEGDCPAKTKNETGGLFNTMPATDQITKR